MEQMKELLKQISEKAIKYEDFNFTLEQIESEWLGNIPALENEIANVEHRLGLKLPEDYREFLKITNGFAAPLDVEPSFAKIEEVDFVKNVLVSISESYSYLPELETAIIIGGKSEEQQFFLLPPKLNNGNWKYWKFANWHPGEQPFDNLKSYFIDVHEFIVNTHER